jgi:tetratricopeptide (TPR) repeat protein
MRRALWSTLAVLLASPCGGDDLDSSTQRVTLGANAQLVAGTEAIRAGEFDEGIRLTRIALERADLGVRDRAAGLANVCAAYVSKNEPDMGIPYCDRALQLDDGNWRVYTVRARAYLLKRMFGEALRDNDAAAAINPNSAHVKEIRGKLNEQLLRPQIVLEDHPNDVRPHAGDPPRAAGP